MNDQETMATLAALRYADAEAVRMFDLAFPQFVDEPAAQQLQAFRDDHQRHVERLDDILRRLGHEQPEPSHEFMAMVQGHFGMIERSTDPDDTIRALLLTEQVLLAEYDTAAHAELPGDVARMAREHHEDEQRHVSYLDQRVPIPAGAVTGGAPGVTTSPPQGLPTRGVGSGGSLGGMGSGAAPRPPKGRSGSACKVPGGEKEPGA